MTIAPSAPVQHDVLHRLGHITYMVTDLAGITETMRRFGQLYVTEERDGETFLTGGPQHYWLRLVQGDRNGYVRAGYQVTDRSSFDEIRNRLDKRGVAYTECEDALASDRVDRWIRFADPDGIELEVFNHMQDLPAGLPPRRVRLTEMLHAVYFVSDAPASADFYRDVLGFKDSDWIERKNVFMRCGNQYHHSLALFEVPAKAGEFFHYCVLCEDIDDLMIARRDAIDADVSEGDILRHAASRGISVYLKEQTAGINYEFCVWHQRITDENHRPRILPKSPSTHDVWRQPQTS